MDPASAILAFVTAGVQVIKVAKETLDDIRNGPKELKILQERASDVEMSLRELQRRRIEGVLQSGEDLGALERLAGRASMCLNDISAFTGRMKKVRKDGAAAVDKLRWLKKGDTLQDLSNQLDRLDNTVNAIMNLVNSRSLARQERVQFEVTTLLQDLNRYASSSATTLEDLTLTCAALCARHSPGHATEIIAQDELDHRLLSAAYKLQCPESCVCRCHSPVSQHVVPWHFVPYTGQLSIPRRDLHTVGVAPWECNVQTCRRDRKTASRVAWYLPSWLAFFDISRFSSRRLPFYVSINSPRLIPMDAKVWDFIWASDIHGLRALFETGQASVYDFRAEGITVLRYACCTWITKPSECSLEVIKFLVNAGADPEFAVNNRFTVKSRVFSFALGTLLDHPTVNFINHLRTSTVAVDLCRSALGMDIVDIVEDILANPKYAMAATMLLKQLPTARESAPIPPTPVDANAVYHAILGITAVEFAIKYLPLQRATQLLRRGVDASRGAPLSALARRGASTLIDPLLNAGADVNAHDEDGWTPLHCASYCSHFRFLKALVRSAEEYLDWYARTPDGKTALDLARESPWLFQLTASEREETLNILRSRIPDDGYESGCSDDSLQIPGAFPTQTLFNV